MYGLVLVTALSAGADPAPVPQPAPQAAPVVMGYGCSGSCLGSCTGYASCFGSCYGSCYGSCMGCYGSCHGHHRGHGLFGHHHASCHGCTGYSCSGWSCFGSCTGYGGCYGSCMGCTGYYGAAYAPGVAMPPYVAPGMMVNPRYTDPWAVYGRVNAPPAVVVPASDAKPVDAKPMDTPVAPKPKEGMGANLKFRLPADAKLYVDGRLTLSTGTERSFTTPPLAAGSKYYYEVKAEVVVDGKPVVEEKRVLVESGAQVTEAFPKLIAAVEGKPTTVAEK